MSIRRTSIKSSIKWGGAVITVLLLIMWLGSGWYSSWCIVKPLGQVGLYAGQIYFASPDDWSIVPRRIDGGMGRAPRWKLNWGFDNQNVGPASTIIVVPVWLLVVVVGAPTLLVWWRDRKHPPGTCLKCGYSRTGLPTDRACPECGAVPI